MLNMEDNVNNWPKTIIELCFESKDFLVQCCLGEPERTIDLKNKTIRLNVSVGFGS